MKSKTLAYIVLLLSLLSLAPAAVSAQSCSYALYDDWDDGQFGAGRGFAPNGCPYPEWTQLFPGTGTSLDASEGNLHFIKPTTGGMGVWVQTSSGTAYGTWEWDSLQETRTSRLYGVFVYVDANNLYAFGADAELRRLQIAFPGRGIDIPIDPGVGVWHRYRVERDLDGTFRFYMDGNLVYADQDTALTTSNLIQFRTQDYSPGNSRLDNLKVVAALPPVVSATVDIDPDTLNMKSKGQFITAYIELPTGSDVNDIDVSTVKLNGVVSAETAPTTVGDHDNDGVPDRMVKFSRAAVIALVNPPSATLTVTGSLTGGITSFTGSDTIRVINPGK